MQEPVPVKTRLSGKACRRFTSIIGRALPTMTRPWRVDQAPLFDEVSPGGMGPSRHLLRSINRLIDLSYRRAFRQTYCLRLHPVVSASLVARPPNADASDEEGRTSSPILAVEKVWHGSQIKPRIVKRKGSERRRSGIGAAAGTRALLQFDRPFLGRSGTAAAHAGRRLLLWHPLGARLDETHFATSHAIGASRRSEPSLRGSVKSCGDGIMACIRICGQHTPERPRLLPSSDASSLEIQVSGQYRRFTKRPAGFSGVQVQLFSRRMRRAAIDVAFAASCMSGFGANAFDRSTLGYVVAACRANAMLTSSSAHCLSVQSPHGEAAGYAILREPTDRKRTILTPEQTFRA